MSAVEEHKPVEKRRALGRGLDSLLPSGPRIVSYASAANAGVVSDPVVLPAAAPSVAPPRTSAQPPEIAETHATREKSPSRFCQQPAEVGHPSSEPVPQAPPALRDIRPSRQSL